MPAENQTVNPSFTISTANASADKPILLVLAGRQGISLIQLDTDTGTFISVQVYHFAKQLTDSNIAEEMSNILSAENLLQQYLKKIYITWCFDENILIPTAYFDAGNAKAMLDLVYGDASQAVVQNEIVLAQDIRLVYRIPVAVKNIVNNWFPFSIQSHQSSLLINIEKEKKDLLYCNFYPNSFTVLLRKHGQLQAIQNFEFATPEDAVYHLLNVCRSFEADATSILLTLSGMIDANSNLYNELYKYFLNIEFASLPANFSYIAEINNYPKHYFSNLFATALCVL